MDFETMDGRRNQREFRHANGRFHAVLTAASGPDGQLIPFLCECADAECQGSVDITTRRYGDIHVHERDYVILPGHMRIAGEEIMEENSYYEIVRKTA